MRALVVYCHPDPQSFTAAVRALVEEKLSAAGAETRTLDLYARGFSPALARQEWQRYLEGAHEGVAEDVAARRLIRLLPEWRGPAVPVYAVTETRLLPAKTLRFIEFLQEQLAPPPAG